MSTDSIFWYSSIEIKPPWFSSFVVGQVFTRYCVQTLGIIIHGMTLDRSLTANLSRMTHSYRANAPSVSMLDGRGADTAVCKKKKIVETNCMWTLIITAAGANRRQAYRTL